MGIEIEQQLAQTGFRMIGTYTEIIQLIVDILDNKNTRYLKAIPYLIYRYKIDTRPIIKNELSRAIIAITCQIFREEGITGIIPEDAQEELEEHKETIKRFRLDYNEFKEEFESQSRKEPPLFIDKQKIYAERDLQMQLSKLFTKKEKQIIGRLLEDKPISRTDYEYYSRKTKKKLGSIIGLQEFAKAIYTKTPKYDEELFRLKRKLERWLEENLDIKKMKILKFSTVWQDSISISYKKESKENIKDQRFNIIKKLSEIKDKEIRALLVEYSEQDFM